MKNYLKFIVAIFGITIATFGSIYQVNAKGVTEIGGRTCFGGGVCGYDNINGTEIPGHGV